MRILFWISHLKKCISFHDEMGYELVRCLNEEDYKTQVYYYVNSGYKVQ